MNRTKKPPNVLNRLATTSPPTSINFYHLNTNTYAFVSMDTQSKNHVVELRESKSVDDRSDFVIRPGNNNQFKIFSHSNQFEEQGLSISSDTAPYPIIQTSNQANEFKLERIQKTSNSVLGWLVNDEKHLFLEANIAKAGIHARSKITGPASNYLFRINFKGENQFTVQHIASNQYIGVMDNRVQLVPSPNYFVRVGVNPFLIKDIETERYLYLSSNGTEFSLKTTKSPPSKFPSHFFIKEPENLFQIYNASNNRYLCASDSTQNGKHLLEARAPDEINKVIKSYFIIKIETDVSILVSCANTKKEDINVTTNFKNIQLWASREKFFLYAALRNPLVPVKQPDPFPQAITYQSKEEFRAYITNFIKDSLTNNLIIYYSGHGSQAWVNVGKEEKNVEQYLCILPLDGKAKELNWYADVDLSIDLNKSLSYGKRVYLIFNCCKAGGMLNLWQLQNRFQHDVIGYFAANAEINSIASSGANGSPYTNAFLKYAKIGMRHYELAELVLDKTFRFGMWKSSKPKPISSAIEYSRPKLCIEKFLK